MNQPNRTVHGNINLIEFKQGSVVPKEKSLCLVLDESNNFTPCDARFEGDEFLGFFPTRDDLAQPLKGNRVLGWTRIPSASQVLKHLYTQPAKAQTEEVAQA